MPDTKVVFVAFAIEDKSQRTLLKGQSRHPRTNYEFVDMSVRQPYATGWKEKVRTRIRRSDGVIALVSKNSLTSAGQKWEIECAKAEGKQLLGLWVYPTDRTVLAGVRTLRWSDTNLTTFIDAL